MKAKAFRDMSQEELAAKLGELRQALFNLRFQHAAGQLENNAQIGRTRRDIARIMTIVNERDRASKA